MPPSLDTAAGSAYARKHGLEALAIAQGSDMLAQEYGAGFNPSTAHRLFSGTKSFWGIAACAASEDGILRLDEPVADTIEAWRNEAWRREVTIAMLLSLTAGFAFGGLGNAVPAYEAALAMPLRDRPGTTFTYGGIPLQVFGALLSRKLATRSLTPHEYLRERILAPAGASIAAWRTLRDGTHPLPTGASMCARDWLAFGRFVMDERVRFSACFVGTAANPRYGLTWWLGFDRLPVEVVYASGSGGQALYLVPSLDLTIVRFGNRPSYRHETFLRRLLGA
jgi:CubicO group peptidase (beta-lactamase class C family)